MLRNDWKMQFDMELEEAKATFGNLKKRYQKKRATLRRGTKIWAGFKKGG